MSVKQVKVMVNELTIGMFVSSLDRPWTQTPFPLQGFYIRTPDDLKELSAHCNYVYIDVVKGRRPIAQSNLKIHKPVGPASGRATKHAKGNFDVAPLKIRREVYPAVEEPLKKEVKIAKQLHQRVYSAVGEVMMHVADGGTVPVLEAKRAASEMVDSVLRNPDAFTWLSRVKETDEHTYSHAVRSAVWAIVFGRHIGLSKGDLDTLAMGVLLKDIGKTKLPHDLLLKTNRTPQEEAEYEKFVELGVEMLRSTNNVEPRTIAVVKTHCERINGSGFPNHLRGDKIPLLGKVAGIVTFYDNTTNPRGESYPLAPSKAVAKLYELRNVEFQEELVVEFIRAIGLYPTGTLVELSTGEVGVVVEQNFERRLKPRVMIVLDSVKNPLAKPVLFDLADDERKKQELIDSGKKHLYEVEKIEIARDLEPGSYEIDIAKIRDDYLFKRERSSLLSFLRRN